MVLTNYWWLLIWLFGAGGVLAFYYPKRQENVLGNREVRWNVLPAIILALPYIIWAGFRPNGFGDTGVYRRMLTEAPSALSGLPEYLSANSKDQGYTVLETLFKSIFGNNDTLFFLLIAAFQLLCIVYVFRKYSSDYWVSFFLFIISTDYLSWMHNGIRQFIAVAGIFACFELIVQKKYIPVILIILLLSTVHGSALIMIPIIFIIQGKAWNLKTIFFICCAGVVIVFIDQFTPLLNDVLADTQYGEMMTNEIWAADDGTNILRILVYSVPAIVSLIGKRYIDEVNDPVINISVNASVCTAVLYCLSGVSSGIYIGRLPIFTTLYGYILIPWLIKNMFNKRSAQLIYICMIGTYLIFYLYQTHFIWGLL